MLLDLLMLLILADRPAQAQLMWEAYLAKCEFSDGLELIDDESFDEFCRNSHEITDPFLVELLDGV